MPYKDPDKQREYMRRWMAARRKAWLQAHGPCVDCGGWSDLQVDHADASTKVTHRVWSWSADRRNAELAKCVTRCEPCHKAKNIAEKARGERNGMTKLTADDVRAIRASTLPLRAAAARYDVDYSLVWQIRHRKIWQHI